MGADQEEKNVGCVMPKGSVQEGARKLLLIQYHGVMPNSRGGQQNETGGGEGEQSKQVTGEINGRKKKSYFLWKRGVHLLWCCSSVWIRSASHPHSPYFSCASEGPVLWTHPERVLAASGLMAMGPELLRGEAWKLGSCTSCFISLQACAYLAAQFANGNAARGCQ